MLLALAVFSVGISLLLLAYTYLGYPLLLQAYALLAAADDPERYEEFPPVTMIVPVHNEAAVIDAKLDNTRSLQYPGSLQVLFVSDSSDDTDDHIRAAMDERIDLLTLSERRGKSHAINRALAEVETPLIVFSDANTMYRADALRRLVAPLADDRVGCVTGRLDLQTQRGESAEGIYWRYELWLRSLERRLGTTVSVNGGLLAVRQADLEPLPESTLTDDFTIAMRIARTGRRVQYEPDAVATEAPASDIFAEFTRRVRIGAGNYQALARFVDLLSPRHGRLALAFFSHKVLRWLGPWFLLTAFAGSILWLALEPSNVVFGILGAQLLCYALAAIGLASASARSLAPVRLPAYFLAMNAALGLGCLSSLRGAETDIWQVTRREE